MKINIVLSLIFCFLIKMAVAEMLEKDIVSLIDNGEYESAIIAISKNSNDKIEKRYLMGRAKFGLRLYKEAAVSFEAAINDGEIEKNLLLWWARSLRNAGNPSKALNVYQQAYNEDKKNQIIIGEYTAVKALNGDYSEASNLFAQITNPDNKNKAEKWRELLKPLVESMNLEPAKLHNIDGIVVCANNDKQIDKLEKIALHAKLEIEKKMMVQLPSFRFLIFSNKESFLKYSKAVHNLNKAVNSPAFTLPGVLAIWNPDNWDTPPHNEDEVPGILKHEMAHLAISAITRGESIPLWLNEGLACKYGGGIDGVIPDKLPKLSFTEVDSLLNSDDEKTQLNAYFVTLHKVDIITKDMNMINIYDMLISLADGDSIDSVLKRFTGKELRDFNDK